jgi:hypothetical protein
VGESPGEAAFMITFSNTVEIARSPTSVFDYLAEF